MEKSVKCNFLSMRPVDQIGDSVIGCKEKRGETLYDPFAVWVIFPSGGYYCTGIAIIFIFHRTTW
ncbi:MAG: hypothetical protein CTY19_00460 [Methylomonas sp.]|nr:MAG: hypothetical protein CTY19_00460 [Methylomonas sp.]